MGRNDLAPVNSEILCEAGGVIEQWSPHWPGSLSNSEEQRPLLASGDCSISRNKLLWL